MDHLTKSEREELLQQRIILIPTKLAREAVRFKIDIQDTCIEAVTQRIHDEKKKFYMKQPSLRDTL